MNSTSAKTILLVEDEVLIAMGEKYHLERFGYEVLTASSGEDAVRLANENHSIDLVLMDINLGAGIDGTEAAREILRTRDVPIVFLSSHAEAEFAERTDAISSYGYVMKGSGIAVLQASIRMAFRLFEARGQLQQSESRYRRLFDNMNSVNSLYEVVVGEDGRPVDYRFLAVNHAFEKQTGKQSRELVGKTLLEVFPATEYYWLECLAEVYASGTPRLFEQYSSELGTHVQLSIDVPCDGQIALAAIDFTERKAAEVESSKQRDLFESVLNSTAELIFAKDLQGRYVVANSATLHRYGFAGTDQMLGKTDFELHSGEIARSYIDSDRSALETDTPTETESSSIIQGRLHFYRTTKSAWRNAQSEVVGVIGVSTDVTEQRELEHSLRKSEENLQAVLNASDQLIALVSADQTVIQLNDVAARLVRMPHEQAIGRKLCELLSDGESIIGQEYMERALTTGEAVRFEDVRTGRSVVTHLFPIPAPDGSVERLAVYIRDITDQKRAELATVQLLQRYQILLERANDGVHILDESGNVVELNSAFCKMLGYSREELLGMNVTEWDTQARGEDLFVTVHEQIDHTGVFETTHRRKNGTTYEAEVSVAGITLDGKRYLHSSARDISTRKRAQRHIASLLRDKQFLLKEVHHRIKNNMSTIQGLLRLQSQSLKSAEAIAALDDAVSRVKSMMFMYDRLYRSPDFKSVCATEYFPELIDQIVESFPRAVVVTTDKHIDDFCLDARYMQPLGMAVNELVTNIMKYAFLGRATGSIQFVAKQIDTRVTVEIQDDGVGMPEELDSQNTGGFGLVLIAAMVRQLNGALSMERLNGTKATIEFDVPPRSVNR